MHTTVELILLNGCETWTLTKTLLKQLDGTYTRILRMILNWPQKVTNGSTVVTKVLYWAINKISTKISRRFLKFAGNCQRRDDEVVSDLVLWEPTHGTKKLGRPPESYIRNLEHETGIPASEMRALLVAIAIYDEP